VTQEHGAGEGNKMQTGESCRQTLVVAREAAEAGRPVLAALDHPATVCAGQSWPRSWWPIMWLLLACSVLTVSFGPFGLVFLAWLHCSQGPVVCGNVSAPFPRADPDR
jgi:hypothetical protein